MDLEDMILFRCAQTIDDRWLATGRHPSGFDYMRIALAICVLLWHSYQVTYGTNAAIIFWTGYPGFALQLILPMFFALSGFLVCASLIRMKNLPSFLALRVIRLFPALVIEIFLSALLIGPSVTDFPLANYFTDHTFYSYFGNVVGWVHYELPGVFLNNPHRAVNTSLWTVPYELECYIAISLVSLIGFFRNTLAPMVALAIATVIVAYLLHRSGLHSASPGGVNGRVLILCFLGGVAIYSARAVIPYSGWLSFACLSCSIVMFRFDSTAYVAPILTAYTTTYLGLLNPTKSKIVTSGDYSYGTYLYAGPIQQTSLLLLGSANSWASNVAVALPATLIMAALSWHLVEKPFQRIKRFIKRGGLGSGDQSTLEGNAKSLKRFDSKLTTDV